MSNATLIVSTNCLASGEKLLGSRRLLEGDEHDFVAIISTSTIRLVGRLARWSTAPGGLDTQLTALPAEVCSA